MEATSLLQSFAIAKDGRHGTGEASTPETWIDFTTVRTEVNLGAVIPDVVGTAGTESYLIEVGVTHFVDQEKLAVLRGLGNPSIEIDLRRFDRESWDWAALDEIVVHGAEAKRWLFLPEQRALRGSTLHPDFRLFSESAFSTGAGFKAMIANVLWWHVCNSHLQT